MADSDEKKKPKAKAAKAKASGSQKRRRRLPLKPATPAPEVPPAAPDEARGSSRDGER